MENIIEKTDEQIIADAFAEQARRRTAIESTRNATVCRYRGHFCRIQRNELDGKFVIGHYMNGSFITVDFDELSDFR